MVAVPGVETWHQQLESIRTLSHLKERQVPKGVDRVQDAAVVMSGRVGLSTLKDGDVQR